MKKYQSILITEATNNIGKLFIKRICENNVYHSLIITSSNYSECSNLLKEIKAAYPSIAHKVYFHHLDIESLSNVNSLCNYILNTHETIDVIINNYEYNQEIANNQRNDNNQNTIKTFSKNFLCPLFLFNSFLKKGLINNKIINTTNQKIENSNKINFNLNEIKNLLDLNLKYHQYLNLKNKDDTSDIYFSKLFINKYMEIMSQSIKHIQFNSISYDNNSDIIIDKLESLIKEEIDLNITGKLI